MLSRGARSIIGIGRVFKIMDDNRSGSVDLEEFLRGYKESPLNFTNIDVQVIFKVFNKNGDGTIDYKNFLRVVSGDLNNFRKGLAMKAFKIMDKDSIGVSHNDFTKKRV